MITLINGDSHLKLKELSDNSIDAVICDPPYGINIKGENWDKNLPSEDVWKECFRVLRPGGFITAMGSSRLYHRLATRIEDVGFISHQMMVWAYASGIPKGMNLKVAFDKHSKRLEPTDDFRVYLKEALKTKSLSANKVEQILGIKGMFSHYLGKSQPQFPSEKIWKELQNILGLTESYDRVIKTMSQNKSYCKKGGDKNYTSYYYGLQTLKPSIEPIYVGQKPLDKNIINNMFKHKVGAYHIGDNEAGEYPANLIDDGSVTIKRCLKSGGNYFKSISNQKDLSQIYYSKKTKRDDFNNHPTVKPVGLFNHLIELFVPKGGIVLDPFMGSGTTGVACLETNRKFIGIELMSEYFQIARRRLTLENAA